MMEDQPMPHPDAGVVNKLIIRQMANGSVAVEGPIADRALCYGLLGLAQDAIREYGARNQSPLVLPR